MVVTAGVLQSMTISCAEGTDKEEGDGMLLSTSGKGENVKIFH